MKEYEGNLSPFQHNRADLFDRVLRDYGSTRRALNEGGDFVARWVDETGQPQQLLIDKRLLRGMRTVLKSLYGDLHRSGHAGQAAARDILADVRKHGS